MASQISRLLENAHLRRLRVKDIVKINGMPEKIKMQPRMLEVVCFFAQGTAFFRISVNRDFQSACKGES